VSVIPLLLLPAGCPSVVLAEAPKIRLANRQLLRLQKCRELRNLFRFDSRLHCRAGVPTGYFAPFPKIGSCVLRTV